MCCSPMTMVSCKVCWSVKWIEQQGVGSRIMILLSLLEGPCCNQRTYIFTSTRQICDLLSIAKKAVDDDAKQRWKPPNGLALSRRLEGMPLIDRLAFSCFGTENRPDPAGRLQRRVGPQVSGTADNGFPPAQE